jgi:hypothetical protein
MDLAFWHPEKKAELARVVRLVVRSFVLPLRVSFEARIATHRYCKFS